MLMYYVHILYYVGLIFTVLSQFLFLYFAIINVNKGIYNLQSAMNPNECDVVYRLSNPWLRLADMAMLSTPQQADIN